MDLLLYGLNHRTAPVSVRERLAFPESQISDVLPVLMQRLGLEEAFLLSTCNRTELLGVLPDDSVITGSDIAMALCSLRGHSEPPSPSEVYEKHGLDAVRHVFRVACGADSMVLGEPQILGQLKQAYSSACEAHATGAILNRVLHAAFRIGKRARTDTALGQGAVSVATIAAQTVRDVFDGDLRGRTALIAGAGEMAEAAAHHLREYGLERLIFVNRSVEKAQQLASALDGECVLWDDLPTALLESDAMVASTSAPGFILSESEFRGIANTRPEKPLVLIDIAVPRDIDPAIGLFPNVSLYDIDDLQNVADRNLQRRQDALPEVEAMVEEAAQQYSDWQDGLETEPLIRKLHERFEAVRREEVERNLKRFCDDEAEHLERLTRLILNKVLHQPTENLREADLETEEGRRLVDAARRMFNLD
jgi:glutamyl-tRNA reductase